MHINRVRIGMNVIMSVSQWFLQEREREDLGSKHSRTRDFTVSEMFYF